MTKYCNKCGGFKSKTLFGKDSRNRDGLQGICEACRKIEKQTARAKRIAINEPVTILQKTCNKCNVTKDKDAFYRDTGIVDGLATICKECKDKSSKKYRTANREQYNADMRTWRANNKDEVKDHDLHRTYGISLIEFNEMMILQKGVCALCFKAAQGKRPLCVDHCHTTGKIRGLLCYGCNRLMVLIDNPVLLEAAIKYKASN